MAKDEDDLELSTPLEASHPQMIENGKCEEVDPVFGTATENGPDYRAVGLNNHSHLSRGLANISIAWLDWNRCTDDEDSDRTGYSFPSICVRHRGYGPWLYPSLHCVGHRCLDQLDGWCFQTQSS